MSKYEKQLDDEKIICPYCQHSYRKMDCSGFDEDDEVEECDNCGKLYHLYKEISVHHNTRPDCKLNGQEHEYEKLCSFCSVCGEIKPLEGGK